MIKIGLTCHSCGNQFALVISSKLMPPRWARKIWKAALKDGWVRREKDFATFCSSCKSQLDTDTRSKLLHPLAPMKFITLLECEGCGVRLQGQEAVIDTPFAHQLRNTAKKIEWTYITLNKHKSYHDFCPNCMPDEQKSKRKRLMLMVWAKSTVRVALDLGISDKAVEKQCKRLGAPKPPRGFWAKWNAGHMEDCRTLIPQDVVNLLGEEFIDNIYPLNAKPHFLQKE